VGGPPITLNTHTDRRALLILQINKAPVLPGDISPSLAPVISFHAVRSRSFREPPYLYQAHTRGHCRSSNYVFIKAEIEHINKMEIGFTECSKSGRFGRRSLARHHSHKPTHKIHTIKMEKVTEERISNKTPGNKPLMSTRGSLIKKISTNKSFIFIPVGHLARFVLFFSLYFARSRVVYLHRLI
jgi:hypothetical protein